MDIHADGLYTMDILLGELSPESSPAPSPLSTILKRKKKQENAIESRHKEKMNKYDKFLKLFKLSVEHQTGKSISSDDED